MRMADDSTMDSSSPSVPLAKSRALTRISHRTQHSHGKSLFKYVVARLHPVQVRQSVAFGKHRTRAKATRLHTQLRLFV